MRDRCVYTVMPGQSEKGNSMKNSFQSDRRSFIKAGAAFSTLLTGGLVAGKAVMAQDGAREYHAAWGWIDPAAGGHFNSFVTNAIVPPPTTIYGDLVLAPLGMYYWGTGEWLPLLAESWEFQNADGGTDGDLDYFHLTLRDGLVWSDGAPLTSQDVVDTMWCFWIMSNTVWRYIDTAEAIDDLNVRFHMVAPSTVVERYIIRSSNPRPSSVFGEWAERARQLHADGKTMDDPEGRQLLDEFSQFHPADVPASGPFMFDVASITNAQMTMPKNEKCWIADQIQFDRIINFNGETDTITPLVLTKDIDYAGNAFPPAVEQEILNNGIRVLRPPTYSGPALFFNFGRLEGAFGDKRARQALAHAIDRHQVGFVSLGNSGVAVEKMAGMADNHVTNWVSDEVASELNGYEYDLEKAEALLLEVGWTKEGDSWKTPEGVDAEFELSFPAEYADWSATGLDIAEQLANFGISIVPRAVTYTQQPVDVDQGNFDLAIRGWGSSSNPHPHFSYTQALFTHNTLAKNSGGVGMDFDLVQETETLGTVDLNTLTIESAEGLDEDAQHAKIETIAQAFNELLPIIPMWERFGNNAALEGVRVKAWPAEDDILLKNSFYADGIPTMLFFTGKLEPAE